MKIATALFTLFTFVFIVGIASTIVTVTHQQPIHYGITGFLWGSWWSSLVVSVFNWLKTRKST